MFDLHVHTSPCVFPRRADDAETVTAYAAAGFSGCVLKGHAGPTAARAARAAAAAGIGVFGGIVLNRSAGGLDASAVAAELAAGGRVVWLPTLDARAHREGGLPLPPGHEGAPVALPPLDPSAESAVRRILRLVAQADAVVATGHLSAAECAWLVAAAREEGVRRTLLTHPTFSVPALTEAAVLELAALGAVGEITAYQLLHGGDAAALARLAAALGPERCVLSSDGGQPSSPSPPDFLSWLVERLVAAGLDRSAAAAMAAETPERLVAP